MKKRIISLALAVLMMLTILPAAYADPFRSLTLQGTAGTPIIPQQITTLSEGQSIQGGEALPPGLALSQDTTGAVTLTGTPTVPGSYTFSLSIVDTNGSTVETVACQISVAPAAPSVSTSASVSCYVGGVARLSVGASAADGGTLSYQWYSSSSSTTYGGTLISGATGAEYIASTASVGTTYYYCVVTNTALSGDSTAVVSAPISVSVTQAVVSSIMICTMPTKTRYIVGESINTAGLSLTVTYGDGSQQVISSGFNVFPTIFTSTGTVFVEMTYGGKSCSMPVTVTTEEDSIQGIGMVALPTKTTYKQGEQLDTTGLVFRAYMADGTYTDIDSGYTYAPRVLNTAGSQEITLTYKNKTCTFTVTVEASQTSNTLEIASSPGKLVYTVGDSLDTSGLVLKVGDKLITSGYTCEPSVLSSAGSQAVRVRYNGLMTTFTVTVNASNASPSPTVSPSASPSASPSVSASPVPSVTPEKHGSGSKNGVLVAVMLIALLCLIALGVYMLIMNAGGVEQFKNQLDYRLYKLKTRFRRRGR